MVEERRALRAFEAHLEEVIGVEEAAAVADRFERHVTRDYLDHALDVSREHLDRRLDETHEYFDRRLEETHGHFDRRLDEAREYFDRQLDERTRRLGAELASSWRRDLLLVSGAQFFALAAAVAALVALA